MAKQSNLTLVGLIVVILVISFVLSLTIPLASIMKYSERIICKSNLEGLGKAMMLYSNDYDGNYPQLPGQGPWAKELGFSYDMNHPDFETDQSNTPRTITASLYLLIREADISPKSFVCERAYRSGKLEGEFDGRNSQDKDIVELWDFGTAPHKHVSYAYQNPYGNYPANKNRSSSFAVAADMNPWFQNGDIVQPGSDGQSPQLLTQFGGKAKKQAMSSNSTDHEKDQNILYADGHTATEKRPNVGVKNDNIYTFWSTEENPSEQDIQGGTAPTSRSADNDAKSETDSFLAI